MLKITTDGRKAALDLRLVDNTASFSFQSKVARCAENVSEIYHKTAPKRSTQLVFCDVSTPKAGFNLYDELARVLIAYGVKEEEIAYIHDAETDRKRLVLFDRVQRGEIRVLLGSTFKLGLGVNVQERLIAIHHLDVPWRPADMVQREGRILRQGNTCDRVFIFRYITEGSFDAYSWQLLETKQRFITQLLSGSLSDRLGTDVDGTVLSYAEVKALAVGNPLVKRRVELCNELDRFSILQRALVETKERMQRELAELAVQLVKQKKDIEACENDLAFCEGEAAAKRAEESDKLHEALLSLLPSCVDKPVETEISLYRGFLLSVPPYFRENDPFLLLKREGEYRLPLGVEGGYARRVDGFIDRFAEQLQRRKDKLRALNAKKRTLVAELKKDDGYAEEMEERRRQIAEIDRELGIGKPTETEES
jgi:superfamily II DNA/RNA helicase